MSVPIFYIPVALLQAASLVMYQPNENDDLSFSKEAEYSRVVIEKSHIVASNGHMLFCAKLENVPEDFSLSIHFKNVESFLKKISNFDTYYFQLSVDPERSSAVMEMSHHYGAYEVFKYGLDDKIFNWQKILIEKPTKDIKGYPEFQTKSLQILDDIAKELGCEIGFKKIHPTGRTKVAYVEFMYSEYPESFALIMPLVRELAEEVKYAVYIEDVTGENEGDELFPAESKDIAFEAVKRMKKDLMSLEKDPHPMAQSKNNFFKVAVWDGSDEEHQEKMFYTKDWLSQPMRRYNDPQKAIHYMTAYNEVVECYDDKSSIKTRSVDEVKKFFKVV